MSWMTTRALSVALLLGTASIAVTGLNVQTPAFAAAAIKIENKELADTVNSMQADARAGRFAEALAKAKTADGIGGKPAELTRAIHGMIVSYAISAKDYPSAIAQIEKMIAANEGDKNANIKQALSISVLMNNKQKVADYAAQLGNNLDADTRLYIAGQLANAGQYKEALAQADPLLKAPNPPEAVLKFEQALYFKMNDTAGRRRSLEALVSNFPKLEYWHDLLQLARNEKGMNDEQALDIFRLRLALGDLKTETDYQEFAQQALIAGYPAEAKAALEKGVAAKIVMPGGERIVRLMKMTNDRVTADTALQADIAKKAAADAASGVKLGLMYWTVGKHKEGEDAIRAAMKGKLADPEAAKIALGHVLFAQGKKPEATSAFDSVARNSKAAPIARLWSIYSRRA